MSGSTGGKVDEGSCATARAAGRGSAHGSRRTTRGPGRPARLPSEKLPPGSPFIDPWARTAWLVATARRNHPDPAWHNRSTFAAALRDLGTAADVTRLSKWESGQHPLPPRVLRGYETLLGQRPGTMVAFARALLRSAGQAPASAWPVSPQERAGAERELAQLLERARAAAAGSGPRLDGDAWLRLATAVARYEHVYVEGALWSTLAHTLLRELARTTGADQVTRYEACSTLLENPTARRALIRAIGEWLSSPETQVFEPMMGLLARVADPAVDDLAVRLLDHPTAGVRNGAVLAVGAKLGRGQLSDRALSRVEEHIAVRAAARPQLDQGTLELVAALPASSARRALGDVAHQAVRARLASVNERDLLVPRAAAARLTRSIALRLPRETSHGDEVVDDPMLSLLLEESLFHVVRGRRVLAARTLSLTPYAEGFAVACLEQARGGEALPATLAWEALGQDGAGQRRADPLPTALSEERRGVRLTALNALSAAPEPLAGPDTAQVAALARDAPHPEVRLVAVGLLGLRAPAALAGLPDHEPAIAAAGRWWAELGPRLSDDS
jgi:hypothetical protein